MYEVRTAALAQKQIKKLPEKIRRAVIEVLIDLEINPYIGKPLTRDLIGKHSYSVKNHRVIYKIIEKDKIVEILKIRHRSIAYN